MTEKQKRKIEEKKKVQAIMHSIFMDIWHKRRHNSEISGRWLGKEALTIFFHHILPKQSFPNAMFDEENIILLSPDEHARAESNPTCFEEVNKRREQLKKKYGRSFKETIK
jgi:hypothetical protein